MLNERPRTGSGFRDAKWSSHCGDSVYVCAFDSRRGGLMFQTMYGRRGPVIWGTVFVALAMAGCASSPGGNGASGSGGATPDAGTDSPSGVGSASGGAGGAGTGGAVMGSGGAGGAG